MIDNKIIKDLGKILSVPVYGEKPATASGEYVVVEFDKGILNKALGNMSIICDSYADSLYDAASLNREVENALNSLIEKDYISGISRNSSYPANVTSLKQYRYKCNFDCNYYEEI